MDIREKILQFLSPPLISINDLEYATAIILLAGMCLAWDEDQTSTRLPHPRVKHHIDNTSGQSWLLKACTSSNAGKYLTSILCSILLAYPAVSLDPVYIATKDNHMADAISRLHTPPKLLTLTDIANLYPQVKSYQRYLPSQELLSEILSALHSNKAPDITQTKVLGRFVQDNGTM